MPAPDPEELVYDEAVRAIERQRATASELRAGASLLIATAAIAISLLDERAFPTAGAACAWIALAAFVVVSLSALVVIWPRHGLPETPQLSLLVSRLTPSDQPSITALRRKLTVSLGVNHAYGARHLMRLSCAFRVGAGALIVQLLATVAARILTT